MRGFFSRLRAQVVPAILGLPVLGTPFWWPDSLPAAVTLPTRYLFVFSFIVAITVLSAVFFLIRNRTRRSVALKKDMHLIMSASRDMIVDLFERQSAAPRAQAEISPHERKHLLDYSNGICESIANHFSRLAGDETTGCAVRIAVVDKSRPSTITQYVTFGRSSKLNRARSATSEPIPIDQGIPNFFRSGDVPCQGVIFIPDLAAATRKGAYVMTQNDRLFPDDIKALAVAPLVGWMGDRKDLIGLLFLTSRSGRVLDGRHVDSMKAISEHLAQVYSTLFDRLTISTANGQLIKGGT